MSAGASLSRWTRPLLVLGLLAPLAPAQSTIEIDDNLIADLFAGLTSFTLSEELVGATYRVDSGHPELDDAHLSTFKLPLRWDLDAFGRAEALHVDFVGGLLRARESGRLPTSMGDSAFSQSWLAWGARAAAGWNLRPAGGWIVRPGVGLGLTRIENEAEYDALGQAELAPLLDGVVTNWDAWAAGLEASLGLIHEQTFGAVTSRFSSRWSLTSTRVFAATSEQQEGSSASRHLALRSQFTGPTGWLWRHEPVDWKGFVAYEGFSRVEREALGFDRLVELGSGLSARPLKALPALSLTASWIKGPGITGWSLGLALGR